MIGHGLLLAFLLRPMTFREIWPQPYCIMPLVEVVSLGIRGTLLSFFARRFLSMRCLQIWKYHLPLSIIHLHYTGITKAVCRLTNGSQLRADHLTHVNVEGGHVG